ncbi:hypothetical protein GDO81_025574 [Engystomops pustulosus]|uniref:Uncharacterized protein n=1 Tax=Engystomops pustulosus TaxID=76066 RepID=A0AAV6ZQ77_ENGPU|nr:hypothetical protein GDO81_025574 [Engystomops pustulosus]
MAPVSAFGVSMCYCGLYPNIHKYLCYCLIVILFSSVGRNRKRRRNVENRRICLQKMQEKEKSPPADAICALTSSLTTIRKPSAKTVLMAPNKRRKHHSWTK